MKNRMVRALVVVWLASVMIVGMAVSASAATPDYSKEIEEMTKRLDGMTVTPSGGSGNQTKPAAPAKSSELLTDDELDAYADKVFALVNKEREKAGAYPLERDSLLDDAAMIRAAEIKVVDNAGGAPHTRPDGTSYMSLLDDMGIEGKRCGENIARAKPTPQDAMKAWMDSFGHRKNILRENYGSIGIGVYQRSDGKIDWVQIFELE